MTTTEEVLRRALRAQADRTTYEATSVLDVARRARALRRRRTHTILLAAAGAVVAAAVPVGLMGSDSDDSDRTPAPAGPTVTIDSLSTLPAGAPPKVDYLLGRTYVFASGRQVELDVEPASVRDAAPYPAGVLVTTDTSPAGIADHLFYGDDGRLQFPGCGGEHLALSDDGALYAYVNPGRGCDRWAQPVLGWGPTREANGGLTEAVVDLPDGQQVEPVGVSVDRILYNVGDPDNGLAGMRVYTTDELGPPQQVRGISRASAWDPDAGRVAGCPSTGRCVVVGEQDETVQLVLDRDEQPLAFSPDGRHLATVTGRDEAGAMVRIRDSRTGDVVVALSGGAFQGDSSVAWESSRHLLIARVDDDGEALVRLATNGTATLATPVAEQTVGGYLLPGS